MAGKKVQKQEQAMRRQNSEATKNAQKHTCNPVTHKHRHMERHRYSGGSRQQQVDPEVDRQAK